MWKLTIKQSRKVEDSNYPFTETVEFENENLTELTSIVVQLSTCDEVHETEYKIERVEE